MRSSTFYYSGENNVQIHAYVWEPDEGVEIIGILQVVHGMAETASRYERLAKYVTQYGYVVYANDHRGHGKTAGSVERLGDLGENIGFGHLVKDIYRLTKIIKIQQPQLPLILFGHSMGSFIVQNYMIHYSRILEGVILSGSGYSQQKMLEVGLTLSRAMMKIKGESAKSEFLYHAIFGKYNKLFKPNRTASDWLSRDCDEVDLYEEDPYCGARCTTGFYFEFFKMLIYIQNKEHLQKVSKKLPIYIFSGDEDPVGENGVGVMRLVKSYEEVGMEEVMYKLYEQGRHEMLNEVNREQVMKELLKWMRQQTSQYGRYMLKDK